MPTAALSAAVYVVSARSAAGVRHKRRQRTHVLLGELPLERGHHPQSIADHAQDALGELVYVELPEPGRTLAQGEACAIVESTKAASDVYAPIAGEVVAINDALAAEPQSVNTSPYEQGWLFTIRPSDAAAVQALMSSDAYDRGPGA